jgi:hypothetical protein
VYEREFRSRPEDAATTMHDAASEHMCMYFCKQDGAAVAHLVGQHRNRLFMACGHSLYALYVNTQGAVG